MTFGKGKRQPDPPSFAEKKFNFLPASQNVLRGQNWRNRIATVILDPSPPAPPHP